MTEEYKFNTIEFDATTPIRGRKSKLDSFRTLVSNFAGTNNGIPIDELEQGLGVKFQTIRTYIKTLGTKYKLRQYEGKDYIFFE